MLHHDFLVAHFWLTCGAILSKKENKDLHEPKAWKLNAEPKDGPMTWLLKVMLC